MTHTRVAAIEGWFTLDDEPHLLGTRCTQSGTYYFPPETTMSRAPGFADSELVPVELSRTGKIWSFTNAGYQPPEPYVPVTDPYEPFAIAATPCTRTFFDETAATIVLLPNEEAAIDANLGVSAVSPFMIASVWSAAAIESVVRAAAGIRVTSTSRP